MANDAQSKAMNNAGSDPSRASATNLLVIAAWFGLVTGLLEGISRTVLQSLGGVSWEMLMSASSVKIFWIAPFFYVILFTLAGAAMALLSRFAPQLPMMRAAVFLFGLASCADVLSCSGRLHRWGIVMLALGLTVVLTRWFNAHEKPALRFWRRSVVWVAALALLAFAGIEGGIRLEEQRAVAALPPAALGSPNVLIIVVDTLRADHLSLYGYKRKTSPKLEKMAEQSVVFDSAIATSSWTLPSHASMLTGLYPSEHGAQKFPLDKRGLMLSEALLTRGYRTAAVSANKFFFTRAEGFGRGFIRFDERSQSPAELMVQTLLGMKIQKVCRRLGWEDVPGRRRAADINRALLRWLDLNRAKPFFAIVNFLDQHDPYLPPQPYRRMFSTKENPGGVFNSFINRVSQDIFTPEVKRDEVDAYDGSLVYVDEQIGQLMAELEKRGLGQNTVVIITSDHGELLGEHDRFGHAHWMYAPVLYVPLIIRWPGKIPSGLRVATPVSLASLPATVMALINGSDGGEFPGPSLAPLWTGPHPPANWPYPWAELAPCEVRDPDNQRMVGHSPCSTGAMKAIVSSEWYFIYHEKDPPQLYDTKKDRAQLDNLAATPDGQAVVAEFLARVRANQMHVKRGTDSAEKGQGN